MIGHNQEVHSLQQWLDSRSLRLKSADIDEDDVRIEVKLIAQHILGLTTVQLLTQSDRALTQQQLRKLDELIQRRVAREPLSHILGSWDFWSLPFIVTPATLTPRPDTEVLVEEVLSWLAITPPAKQGRTIIDVGTGTGCIGLSLASELPELAYELIDLSKEALQVAQHNSERLINQALIPDTTKLTFTCSDLLAQCITSRDDVIAIVSNPPYIQAHLRHSLMPEVRDFDPPMALFDSSPDGLQLTRQLISQAALFLPDGGGLFIEVGYDQTESTYEEFLRGGFTDVRIRKDYAGHPRVVRGIKARPLP